MKIINRLILSIGIMISALLILYFPSCADMGPKPSISLVLENAPQDYYVGLLVEADKYGKADVSLDDEMSIEEFNALCTLTGYDSDGWIYWDGNPVTGTRFKSNANHKYNFTYMVPSTFRVIVVSLDGQTYISNKIKKQKFNAECTYDLATGQIKENVLAGTGKYLIFVLVCYLATLFFEGIMLILFGLFNRKNLKCFFMANTITQVMLNSVIVYMDYKGMDILLVLIWPLAELAIIIVESLIYRKRLIKKDGEISTKRNVGYAIAANIFSIVAGLVALMAVF
ncbi:MAG: hypothetical protein IKN47_05475 [Lachnospiraceae bacterium]|nr:hypothetical protein [Lachnospiraceae bacterium]